MIYDDYEKLKNLEESLANGSISQEEFEQEKAKILSGEKKVETETLPPPSPASVKKPLFGLEENLYLLLMHLSQFVSAFIAPLVMWLIGKDENKRVDLHGKNIMNFIITYAIWFVIGIITIPIIVGIVILSVWGVVVTVFIIIASIKAYNGEDWKYPLTIQFLK